MMRDVPLPIVWVSFGLYIHPIFVRTARRSVFLYCFKFRSFNCFPSKESSSGVSSMRRFLFVSRSIVSRKVTTVGRIISEAILKPPISVGETTAVAPAFFIFSAFILLWQLATTFMFGLICRAERLMTRFLLSSSIAAKRPLAFSIPAFSALYLRPDLLQYKPAQGSVLRGARFAHHLELQPHYSCRLHIIH